MNKLIFAAVLSLIVISCGKWEENKKDNTLTYYTEDFKDKDVDILGVPAGDIDAAWVEFYSKEKEYDTYALIVKMDGEFTKEWGTCTINWEEQIDFSPENGDTYTGTWISEKDKYTISMDVESRTEELTFIYKEVHDKCGKW
jgi:hypothetical protein